MRNFDFRFSIAWFSFCMRVQWRLLMDSWGRGNEICRELNRIPNPWETKIRENTRQRKTISRTRQYLRGSAICLRPRSCRDITIIREEYRVQLGGYNILYIYIAWQPYHTKNPNYKRWFHNGLNGPNRPQ